MTCWCPAGFGPVSSPCLPGTSSSTSRSPIGRRCCRASSASNPRRSSRWPWSCSGASDGQEGSGTTMTARQDQSTKAESMRSADGAVMAPPCAMVIFGAAGDLTKRLVTPALYNLVNAKRLPDRFQLVGVDLAAKTAEEWRKGLTDTMNELITLDGEYQADHIDKTAWRWLTD